MVDVVTREGKAAPLTWSELDQNFVNLATIPGVPGPAGPPGGSTSVFPFRADAQSQNMSDPGAGKMRWNNANQQQATLLAFDRLDQDGFDVTLFFQLMNVKAKFIIQDEDLAVNYQVWKLTGPAIVSTDHFNVPVEFVSASGTGSFNNNASISILIEGGGTPVGSTSNQQVLFNRNNEVGGSDKLRFDEARGLLVFGDPATADPAFRRSADGTRVEVVKSNLTHFSKLYAAQYIVFGGQTNGDIASILFEGAAQLGCVANELSVMTVDVQKYAPLRVSKLTALSQSLTGSQTTPLLDLSTAWNTDGAVSAIRLDVTSAQGASAGGSYFGLLDLRYNGTSMFYLSHWANLIMPACGNGWSMSIGGGNILRATDAGFAIYSGTFALGSGTGFKWAKSAAWYDTMDVGLYRSAAGVLEINDAQAMGAFRDLNLRTLFATNQLVLGATYFTPFGAGGLTVSDSGGGGGTLVTGQVTTARVRDASDLWALTGYNGLAGLIGGPSMSVSWAAGAWYGTVDVAVFRNAAGVIEINNGAAGTFRDLILRSLRATGMPTAVTGLPAGTLWNNGGVVNVAP